MPGAPILVEDIQENLASHHAILQAFGVFAAARGWTVNYNYQNVQWADTGGGVYGFIAGTESYLEIQSTGEYTNQFLHYRFRGEATGSVANHEWLRSTSMKAGDTGFDTTSAIHPIYRASTGNSNWNTRDHLSVNPNSTPKVFFFGNGWFLCMVIQHDSSTISFLCCGSLALEDSTETQGSYLPWSSSVVASTYYWFNRNHTNPFDNEDLLYYIDNESKPQAQYASSIIGNTNNSTIGGEFFRYGHILNFTNSYSDIKPLMAPMIFVQYDSDSLWRKAGELPVLRMRSNGNEIGEKIDYGGKEYRVFPNVRQQEWVHGVAIRVA